MKINLHNKNGYTLVEIMMAQGLFALAMLAACSFYLDASKSWKIADVEMNTSYDASQALERIIYGIGPNTSLRSARSLSYAGDDTRWTLTINGGIISTITYDSNLKALTYTPGDIVICENVKTASAIIENGGVTLSVTVNNVVGEWDRTRTMTTFVALRNPDA